MARVARESIDRFYDYNLHLETRTIYLGDESEEKTVGPGMAGEFVKAMHLLHASNKEAPIKVLMNTIGGCAYNGMAIYDAIKTSTAHVSVEVVGSAMSMGALILQAADERIMCPNAVLMLHDGSESIDASVRTFENWAEFSKMTRRQWYRILADRTGKKIQYWEKHCNNDYILDAKQSLAEGLIDRIAGNE